MELLAAEAKVAKPTIYAHFKDKEALFRAVVEAVSASIYDAAKEASEAGGPLEERVAAMLAAKHTRYWELVQASPHAEELVRSQDELAAAIVKRFDRAYAKLLGEVLAAGGLRLERFELTAASCAQLLIRATSGAGYDATSVASHRRNLREIVHVLLGALR
jgi:AcrR family transcriptional regulator